MVKKVAQRAIAAGLAGMMSFGALVPAAVALDDRVYPWWAFEAQYITDDEDLTYFKRIAGDTRYDTMKKIVEATYKLNSDNFWHASAAVVASGDNFPDALAANGFAGALNGGDGAPLILTKKGTLSSQAKTLLKNMQVQHVYIMGGTSAVSQDVEDAIRDLKISTTRVAGADRQATSADAFRLMDGNWAKEHGTHSLIIATGANYADALSIAPFAYATGTPIMLTKADGTLTDEQVKLIKDNDEIWRLIIVGGTSVVSDSVITSVGTYNGKYNDYKGKVYITYRIAGADRYDTSAKVADWEVNEADKWLANPYLTVSDYDSARQAQEKINKNVWENWAGFTYDWTFIATGENFPDALAGGQLAGGHWYISKKTPTMKPHSPILLTKDGNRAADSVIASNLAWNWRTYDNAAYARYVDWNTWLGGFNPFTDFTTYSQTVDEFINEYLANGFFTSTSISDLVAGTTADRTALGEFLPVPNDFDLFVYDNTVARDCNFMGIIFGGTAAVSKDKAKQLDDTVKDTIGGTARMTRDGFVWERSAYGDYSTIVRQLANRYFYAENAPVSTNFDYLTNFYNVKSVDTDVAFENNVSGESWGTYTVTFDHFAFEVDPYVGASWRYKDSDLKLRFDIHRTNGVVDGIAPVFFF